MNETRPWWMLYAEEHCLPEAIVLKWVLAGVITRNSVPPERYEQVSMEELEEAIRDGDPLAMAGE